jgi:Zinc finger, C3HC4 type (RING finger)
VFPGFVSPMFCVFICLFFFAAGGAVVERAVAGPPRLLFSGTFAHVSTFFLASGRLLSRKSSLRPAAGRSVRRISPSSQAVLFASQPWCFSFRSLSCCMPQHREKARGAKRDAIVWLGVLLLVELGWLGYGVRFTHALESGPCGGRELPTPLTRFHAAATDDTVFGVWGSTATVINRTELTTRERRDGDMESRLIFDTFTLPADTAAGSRVAVAGNTFVIPGHHSRTVTFVDANAKDATAVPSVMSIARAGYACEGACDTVVCAGGEDWDADHHDNTDLINVTSRKRQAQIALSTPRSPESCKVTGMAGHDWLLFVGGAPNFQGTVDLMRTDTFQWVSTKMRLAVGRSAFTTASAGPYCLVAGGITGRSSEVSTQILVPEVEIFHSSDFPLRVSARRLARLAYPRRNLNAVIFWGRFFLATGGRSTVTDDEWSTQPSTAFEIFEIESGASVDSTSDFDPGFWDSFMIEIPFAPHMYSKSDRWKVAQVAAQLGGVHICRIPDQYPPLPPTWCDPVGPDKFFPIRYSFCYTVDEQDSYPWFGTPEVSDTPSARSTADGWSTGAWLALGCVVILVILSLAAIGWRHRSHPRPFRLLGRTFGSVSGVESDERYELMEDQGSDGFTLIPALDKGEVLEDCGTSSKVMETDHELLEVESAESSSASDEVQTVPLDDFDDSEACTVCLSAKIDSSFVPCGHNCCCARCAKKCEKHGACPICRKPIDSVMKTFRS